MSVSSSDLPSCEVDVQVEGVTEETATSLTSSNRSVHASTSTSDTTNSNKAKSIKLTACLGETGDPKNLLELGAGTGIEIGGGMTPSKIEDVKTSINKIIRKSQSPKNGLGDPSAKEIQIELGDQIQSMNRSDLEALIVDRIIEEISIHSNVGVLNEKLRQANSQKDRLFQRMSNLQRQVIELSKTVRSVAENIGRNQKTVPRANLPIRFYRSVGVQVLLDSSAINPPPRTQSRLSLSRPEFSKPTAEQPTKSVRKSGNNNMFSSLGPQFKPQQKMQKKSSSIKPVPASLSTDLNGNGHSGLKRTMMKMKPSISVAEVGTQIEFQNSKVRKVGNPVPSVSSTPSQINTANSNTADGDAINSTKESTRSSPVIQEQQQKQQLNNKNSVKRNPAAAVARRLNGSSSMLDVQGGSNVVSIPKTGNGNIEPGIIDLTNEGNDVVTSPTNPEKKTVPPAPATVTATVTTASIPMMNEKNNGVNLVLLQNGVQYRLVSQIKGGPIGIRTGGQIMTRPLVTSAAVQCQQQAKNDGISLMGKQKLFQQKGQPINAASMVPKQPQQRQGATQVNANNVVTNNPGRLQTVSPMDQVPRANTRAVVKKFVLPPLPPPAIVGNARRCAKDIPPRPDLSVAEGEGDEGIVLSWTIKQPGSNHAEIQTYQIYACEEPLPNHPKSGSWKRVGDVKALPLPMACTLSKLSDGNRYHIIVRGVDVFNRTGPFSKAADLTLTKKSSGQDR